MTAVPLPGPGRRGVRLRRPPGRLLLCVGIGVAVLAWTFTGWSLIAAALAFGAALLARLALTLVPARWRPTATAPLVGVLVLLAQTPPAGAAVCAGLAIVVIGATQTDTARAVAIGVGMALALTGTIGLVVGVIVARRSAEADAQAADAASRARMLPRRPDDVAAELMRAIAVTRRDSDTVRRGGVPRGGPTGTDLATSTCTTLFDQRGAAAYAAANNSPDCPAALRRIAAALTDPPHYDHYQRGSVPVQAGPDGTVRIDICHPTWADALAALIGTPATTTPPGAAPRSRRCGAVPGRWMGHRQRSSLLTITSGADAHRS